LSVTNSDTSHSVKQLPTPICALRYARSISTASLRHDLLAVDDAMNGLPVARFVNIRLLFLSDGTPSGNVHENVFICRKPLRTSCYSALQFLNLLWGWHDLHGSLNGSFVQSSHESHGLDIARTSVTLFSSLMASEWLIVVIDASAQSAQGVLLTIVLLHSCCRYKLAKFLHDNMLCPCFQRSITRFYHNCRL